MTRSESTSEQILSQVIDHCLDAVESGEMSVEECLAQYPGQADALAPLLHMAIGLRDSPRPIMSDTSVARLERTVIAHAVRLATRRATRQPAKKSIWRPLLAGRALRMGATLVLVVIIGSGAGTVAAASESLPGEPLYPVKRGIESVRLSLASEERRPELLANLVRERLEEVEELLEQREVTLMAVEELVTAADMAVDSLDGNSDVQYEEQIVVMLNLTHRQQEIISSIIDSAPEQDMDVLVKALEASQEGHQRMQAVAGEGE